MSRTLRRPMFRGGPVSSYGKGIAAPLVPGYQGGGQIGGGIIYGKPMADGRYGFSTIDLFDVKDAIGEIETGQKVTDDNVPESDWENLVKQEKFKTETIYDEDFLQKQFDSFVKGVEQRVGQGEDDAFQTDVDLGLQLQPPISDDDSAFWKIYNKDPDKAYKFWKDNISTWGKKQEDQMKHAKEIGANVDFGIKTETSDIPDDSNLAEIKRLKALLAAKEEPTELDAKTMVEENKALFSDLLGVKKARGQDISDMLLGFAGAEGDDTWSKTKEFFRTEKDRPSRVQKLEDTASGLAIQDYIAGKRSKEQMLSDKSKIDYAQDVKLQALMPNKDDSPQRALIKFAQINGTDSVNSERTIKDALEFKTKKPVVRNTKIKLDDVENPNKQKKLQIGINIIEKDNIKYYVEWDGTKVDIHQTIEDVWSKY